MSNAFTLDGIDYCYEIQDDEMTVVAVTDNEGFIGAVELDHSCESAYVVYRNGHNSPVRYYDILDWSHQRIAEWIVATA